jgi:transcriptional regulator with XRE-family HTH domain
MQTAELLELSRVRSLAKLGTARSIRVAAGLTLGEVAGAVGVSEAAISRWESGERKPRGAAALKYAEVLQSLLGDARPSRARAQRAEVIPA